MPFILSLDQGTTSSRAIMFDHAGRVVGSAQKEFRQIFPRSGWVEHDPAEIWRSQLEVANQVARDAEIVAVGITNQRETTILWDRRTGKPVFNAIVWQDRRTADFCEELKKQGHERTIAEKTGLVIDAYFSASKIRWILDHVPGARAAAQSGELAFGTVDSWLLWNLTAGKMHATDPSNAARTMLYNIHTREWDDQLLSLFDIPREILPQINPSSSDFGSTDAFGRRIPICGIAGDQQAALFGQTCFDRGLAKNTYGTGCFMLMNIGD
ncbi:MAG TPA: FGGY family carbohydrate kinase, partial [Tepidisphaeraceae bacterium]|nr:FGGY family carbohydrate kinase [Tepidisphaeraceae bacterium]